jgi:hypothetical protein
MAMAARTKDVRAHVIALRASSSWSLEQRAEWIARRFLLSSPSRGALYELVSRAEEDVALRAFRDY